MAILLFSTPGSILKNLLKNFKTLFQKEDKFDTHQDELLSISQQKLKALDSKSPLIFYAGTLWEQGVDSQLFIALLSQKKDELAAQYVDTVQTLKNLAKYPPALGMTGTVMGMIALFADLDQNKNSIGSNLALAMTATFFGLIVTNAIISPLADRLHVKHINSQRYYTSLLEILVLIDQKQPGSLVAEEVENRAS